MKRIYKEWVFIHVLSWLVGAIIAYILSELLFTKSLIGLFGIYVVFVYFILRFVCYIFPTRYENCFIYLIEE